MLTLGGKVAHDVTDGAKRAVLAADVFDTVAERGCGSIENVQHDVLKIEPLLSPALALHVHGGLDPQVLLDLAKMALEILSKLPEQAPFAVRIEALLERLPELAQGSPLVTWVQEGEEPAAVLTERALQLPVLA